MEKKKEKWMIYNKKADFEAIGRELGVSPVLVRILRNRGLTEPEEFRSFFYDTPEDMHDPWLMKDMARAVNLIFGFISAKKKIRVIADYDIDGVCSGTILVRGLRSLGADVDLAIPDRVRDGYGINQRLIDEAHAAGVSLIVTCDNGIAAVGAVAHAKELGMTVIVTDHHDIPFEEDETGRREILPPADAILNPKQADCGYPFKELCGAGVAYKLIDALYRQAGRGVQAVRPFLELAGIATIGDIVALQGENHIIAKYGLKDARQSHYVGLRCLAEASGISPEEIDAYRVGFVLGPCLNAGGRLESAMLAAELLLYDEDEQPKAEACARKLKELNDQRKGMTEDGVREAMEEAERFPDDQVLVLYLKNCSESVAGIVAGRIREYFYRPVIILTNASEGVKGSGRSVEGYSMFEKISACKDLLTKFGGHPMAAGLSLPEENIDEFRIRLNRDAGLTPEDLTPKVHIDLKLPFYAINERLIEELKLLEPTGKANERAVFAQTGVRVEQIRILGAGRNVARLTLTDSAGTRLPGILFLNEGEEEFLNRARAEGGRRNTDAALLGRPSALQARILFTPELNEYRGMRSIQLRIRGIEFYTAAIGTPA
ncbi:MAG: single-stranded-DNA-specific exonuclease RecJ [Lachnospiraceae bacterium]|nr:single-stranded-DNA-specific exonuclease RecJ [Lachnospiraceae bacterium]